MSIQAAAAAAAADVQNRPPRLPQSGRGGTGVTVLPLRPAVVVDREKTCPLLLRVFTKHASHHTVDDFGERGKEPKDEVQIYTWKDATLQELTDLVKEVAPLARRRDARLSFAFVYPNRRGKSVMRVVGTTNSNGRKSQDDNKTLEELSFQIGDFLDVAIYA